MPPVVETRGQQVLVQYLAQLNMSTNATSSKEMLLLICHHSLNKFDSFIKLSYDSTQNKNFGSNKINNIRRFWNNCEIVEESNSPTNIGIRMKILAIYFLSLIKTVSFIYHFQ